MKRPWLSAGVAPPPLPRCECGDPSAPFGIGPPAQAKQQWLCATCNQAHPFTQAALAEAAREALEGDD